MPLYYVILIILIVIVVFGFIFNLLTSPITWGIIAVLLIYSAIKKYLYAKQLEEYNKEFQRKAEEKKQAYYNREKYQQGSDDIIDVDYKEFEDK